MTSLEQIYKSKKSVPFICGGHINGLGLIRSFEDQNLKPIVIDYKRNISAYSKFATWLKSPNPINETEFIEFLIQTGKKLSVKGFLLVTNDIWLIPIAKNQDELRKHFHLPMSDWATISEASTKTELYAFAKEQDIPHPRTIVVKDVPNTLKHVSKLNFPIIIKPSNTVDFENLNISSRNAVLDNTAALEKWLEKFLKLDVQNIELIAQEYIPGGVNNLYTFTSYTNLSGEIKAFSIGHKLRQNPPLAGTITAGKVTFNDQLFETAEIFFKKFKFHGIANTEFKFDHRDNSFKLIEINARPGKWNSSVLATGINLPLIAYNDIVNRSGSEKIIYNKQEIIWIDALDDYVSFSKSYSKSLYSVINLIKWRKTLKSHKLTYAIFRMDDILPSIMNLSRYLKAILLGNL